MASPRLALGVRPGSLVVLRALMLLLAGCTLPMLPVSARGQCAHWADSGVSPPASIAPPSFGWAPPSGNMVYDSRRGVSVLFGGNSIRNQSRYLFAFRYDGNNWVYENASPEPLDRILPSLTFDTARGRILLFGGEVGIEGTNETWEFDGARWYAHPVAGAWPRPSVANPICYDPHRSRAIMLGYSLSAGRYETWEWNGSTWSRGPDLIGADDTAYTRMVFDIGRDRAFVYTKSDTDQYERAFEYTPGATAALGVWHQLSIAGSPYPALLGVALVYDSHRGQIFRIAGRDQNGLYGFQAETYVWNVALSKWAELSVTSDGLPVRGAASAVFDANRDRIVLYGGLRNYLENGVGRSTTYTDTWEYTQASPGFITQPASAISVDGGQPVLFAAALLGEDNTMQWLHSGVPIAGATFPSLSVPYASHGHAGSYVLRVTNPCGTLDSLPAVLTVRPPFNETAASASAINSAFITGTTHGASFESAMACGNSDFSPDVWFKYIAPYPGTLTMDTCGSDFDTVLSFHTCCTGGSDSLIACSDDDPLPGCGGTTSSLTWALQGQQFLVRMSGYNGSEGNFTLNTKLVPINGSCGAAAQVYAGRYYGSTVGVGANGTASCGTSNSTGAIWYRFHSDCSGTLGLDTAGSSYDTVMSVRSGCTGTELACNDDVQFGTLWSSISMTVQANSNYYIRVSGYNGNTGDVVLHVYPPAVAGDTCDGAAAIDLGQTAFATGCATTEPLGLPPTCVGAPGAVPFNDLWYRYVAAAPGQLEVRVCNATFSPALAVYGAACPTSPYDALVCAASDNSCFAPLASFPTLPGEEYLLRIGGFYGAGAVLSGSGTLILTLVPFPTGACCLATGGCSPTSAYECEGDFQGVDVACSPMPCPSQAGSCCTGAHCSVMEPSDCTAASGSFGGTGSTCLDSTQNPVTCCRANFDGVNGLQVADIFAFLNAWFAGDPRAEFDRDGVLAVQDIFSFLNAWFAGCT